MELTSKEVRVGVYCGLSGIVSVIVGYLIGINIWG